MSDAGEVAGSGKAAGSGLQAADTAECGGEANGTAAVGTDTTGGEAGGDGRGFATGGTAGGECRIGWMVGGAVDVVIGFPIHEVGGSVGLAKDGSAGGEETVDAEGIG